MGDLVGFVVAGIAIGSAYALVAAGFAIVIRATGLINLAHPEFVMVGALVGHTTIVATKAPYALVLILVALLGIGCGVAFERFVLRPMVRRRARLGAMILATVGVAIALRKGAVLVWGADPRAYPAVYPSGFVEVLGVRILARDVVIILIASALLLTAGAVFKWTRIGIAMRAASQDRDAARLMGVRTTRTDAVSLAAGSGLATVAGALIAPIFFARPDLGIFGLKAFAATALGGLDSVVGAALGGIVLGIAETLGGFYISTAFKDVIAYLTMAVVLLIRPQGLLGTVRRNI